MAQDRARTSAGLVLALTTLAGAGCELGSAGSDQRGEQPASSSSAETTGESTSGSTGWPDEPTPEGSGGTSDGADLVSTGEPGSSSGEPADLCPRVRISVAAGSALNVRPTPSTELDPVGSLPNNAVVDVLDEVVGESIDGVALWYEVAAPNVTGFILSAFASCTQDEAPELMPPEGFWLPLECSTSANISQGNFGAFSHQGRAAYAFDFSLGVGTPLTAMADGIVWHVYDQTGPGDPCYSGGGPGCFPYANLVVLMHGDGTTSVYKHLSEVMVGLGEFVPRGVAVGLSGSSGYSTGPHAHVMRQEDCGDPNCDSIPLSFEDVPGDGVPSTGEQVTSGNCP